MTGLPEGLTLLALLAIISIGLVVLGFTLAYALIALRRDIEDL